MASPLTLDFFSTVTTCANRPRRLPIVPLPVLRLALRDQGALFPSYPPRRLAREERRNSCCCCCQCRSSGGNFGEVVIELLAGGGGYFRGDFEVHFSESGGECCNHDYNRFERPRKSWRKEVEIRDGNRKKERSFRARRGGSSLTCHSRGSSRRGSRRRNRGYEEVNSFDEDDYSDAVSDISTEMEYSSRRVPQRESRYKEGGQSLDMLVHLAGQEKIMILKRKT